MGKHKKKFIDKKKSATFQLLARDSSDPNYNVGPDGDRVFVRIDNNAAHYSIDEEEDGDPDSRFADALGDEDDDGEGHWDTQRPMQPAGLPDEVRKEILELGFPDDGYNYLVHMRDIKNAGAGSTYYENPKAKLDKVSLDVKAYDASKVHISEVNSELEATSMYSVSATTFGVRVQKASDPEVVALMDGSDSLQTGSDAEELEDDFVFQANVCEEEEEVAVDKKLNSSSVPEGMKEANNHSDFLALHKNVYEISSTDRVRYHQPGARNGCDEKPNNQRILGKQFDVSECYDTGAGEACNVTLVEEVESLDDKFKAALKEYMIDDLEIADKSEAPADMMHGNGEQSTLEFLNSDADVIQRCVEYAKKYENESEDENFVVIEESSDESEAWDCETIVSTYSNLENHPGKIEAPGIIRKKKLAEAFGNALSGTNPKIALGGKEKLPVNFLPAGKKAAKNKDKILDSVKNEPQRRRQLGQESKEEKKERKTAVKEERREARRLKKEMKGLYKCEGQRAQKVAAACAPSVVHLM